MNEYLPSCEWSMYDSADDDDSPSAVDTDAPSALFDAPDSSHSLRGAGLVKLGVIARGSQGSVYLAKDATSSCDGVPSPRVVAVKRLYSRENPYGNVGMDPTVLREATVMHYVTKKQKDLLMNSGASPHGALLDETASVLELYRILEAPFEEMCLVLEYCATDLHAVCVTLPTVESEEEEDFRSAEAELWNLPAEAPIYELGTRDGWGEAPAPCCEGETPPPRGLFAALNLERSSTSTSRSAVPTLIDSSPSAEERSDLPIPLWAPPPESGHVRDERGWRPQESLLPAVEPCSLLRSVSVLRFLMRRVLRLLTFLHEDCKVCHRDIKPSNFLVLASGGLRLADFGSACLLCRDAQHSDEDTCRSTAALTPTTFRTTRCYAAPECMLGHAYGPSMDVWSAGVLFMELVLQRPLFTGRCELTVLSQIYDLLLESPSQEEGAPAEGTSTPSHPSLEELLTPLLPGKGVQFMRGLLSRQPEQRLTAREALQHPFLKFTGWEADDEEGQETWREKVQRSLNVHPRHPV